MHVLTYMWNLEKTELIEMEELGGCQGWGK